eukprot:745558-Rhodomonas_salina.2
MAYLPICLSYWYYRSVSFDVVATRCPVLTKGVGVPGGSETSSQRRNRHVPDSQGKVVGACHIASPNPQTADPELSDVKARLELAS